MHASFTHSSKIEHQTYLKVNYYPISQFNVYFIVFFDLIERLGFSFVFTGMIIVTDRFHGQQAHETCPASFKLDYWNHNIEAREWASAHSVNSSTAEQLNAKLRNLEKHIRVAKFSNTIAWTKKFCEFHNMMVAGLLTSEHVSHN